MDLVLSAEQELLQQTAREFVAGRSSLKRVRSLRDGSDPDGFSRALWTEMAHLGWLGIVLPVEHDGLGLGYMELMVVMEELGRGLMPEPMLSTVLLGGTALLLGGSTARRAPGARRGRGTAPRARLPGGTEPPHRPPRGDTGDSSWRRLGAPRRK